MPTIGSPAVIVVIATVNVCLGIGLALVSRPRSMPTLAVGLGMVVVIGFLAIRPGTISQPNEAYIASRGGTLFASTEDEIASVQAGQISSTPELWVGGTSMTLLTIDAKLMPILPLIARPDSKEVLVVAFGMGSAFRGALIAGLQADAVELVPSVPDMFGFYYDDADAVLADPDGKVIIADGRNHLELSDRTWDIILTDPPPPIESSGASVISSLEYYEAGRDHLSPGGIMMQWTPVGEFVGGLLRPHPHIRRGLPERDAGEGRGRLRRLHDGFDGAVRPRRGEHPRGPGAARDPRGHLVGVRLAGDDRGRLGGCHRSADVDDRRRGHGDGGRGPLITDDLPRPEYFLLRRLFGL